MNNESFFQVNTQWLEMFLALSKSQREHMLDNMQYRAIFLTNGYYVCDTMCSLDMVSHGNAVSPAKIKISLNDGNTSRADECDQINILDNTDVTIIQIKYNHDEWSVEYGTTTKIIPLFI